MGLEERRARAEIRRRLRAERAEAGRQSRRRAPGEGGDVGEALGTGTFVLDVSKLDEGTLA
jgi:hypothetical protein